MEPIIHEMPPEGWFAFAADEAIDAGVYGIRERIVFDETRLHDEAGGWDVFNSQIEQLERIIMTQRRYLWRAEYELPRRESALYLKPRRACITTLGPSPDETPTPPPPFRPQHHQYDSLDAARYALTYMYGAAVKHPQGGLFLSGPGIA